MAFGIHSSVMASGWTSFNESKIACSKYVFHMKQFKNILLLHIKKEQIFLSQVTLCMENQKEDSHLWIRKKIKKEDTGKMSPGWCKTSPIQTCCGID